MEQLHGQTCTSMRLVAYYNDRQLAAGRFDAMRGYADARAGTGIVPVWNVPDPAQVQAWQNHVGPLAASLLRVVGPDAQ